jgi:hypothetical protein
MRLPLRRTRLAWVLGCASPLCATACTTHQCDPSFVTQTVGTWRVVGDCSTSADCELVWASSATDDPSDPWLTYPGERTYTLVYPPLPALPPGLAPDFRFATPVYWVAAVQPDEPDADWAVGAGYVAEFGSITSASLEVTNASCAQYSILVQMTVPVVRTSDAGSD